MPDNTRKLLLELLGDSDSRRFLKARSSGRGTTVTREQLCHVVELILADLEAMESRYVSTASGVSKLSSQLHELEKSTEQRLILADVRTDKLFQRSKEHESGLERLKKSHRARARMARTEKEFRKRMDQIKEAFDALKSEVQTNLESRIKADETHQAIMQTRWDLLKTVVEISVLATLGGMFGMGAVLLARGVMSANPWTLAAGAGAYYGPVGILGPTTLEGTDGETYLSMDVTKQKMTMKDRLLVESHSASERVYNIIAGSSKPGSGSLGDIQLTGIERVGGAIAEQYQDDFKKYGVALFAPHVISSLTVPDIYHSNFKYFYATKSMELEELKSFTKFLQDKPSPETVQRELETSGRDRLVRYRFKGYTLGGWHTFTKLDELTYADYPEELYPDAARIRLHYAGFIKYVEQEGWGSTVHDSSGGRIWAKSVDIPYHTDHGGNQLKSYIRKHSDKLWGMSFSKLEKGTDKLPAPYASLVYNPFHETSGTESTLMRGKFYRGGRASFAARHWQRKVTFVSWYIVHKMFELHLGSPIPVLIHRAQDNDTFKDKFCHALVDILCLVVDLSALDHHSPGEWSHGAKDWKAELWALLKKYKESKEKTRIHVRSHLYVALLTSAGVADMVADRYIRAKLKNSMAWRHRMFNKRSSKGTDDEALYKYLVRLFLDDCWRYRSC